MTTSHNDDEVSLYAARRVLMDAVSRGERVTCPCCDQTAKVYRRALHAGMARQLILLFKRGNAFEREWVPVRRIYLPGSSGDYAKLRFWDLIEPYDQRSLAANASGHWRITTLGIEFLLGHILVPRYVFVYNNNKVGADYSQTVSIWQALGESFDYAALMSGPDRVDEHDSEDAPADWEDDGEGIERERHDEAEEDE